MITLNSFAMAFFQDAASQAAAVAHDLHLMRIFVVVIALALVAQACGVMLAAVYAAQLLHILHKAATNLQEKALPLVAKTNELLHDLTPKINSISTNVEQVSYTVREKIDELGQTVSELNKTVSEANSRTRVQVARVDGIVTEALATTEDVSRTVQQGIRVPVREIAALIAGVKTAIETLIQRSPFGKRQDL